MSTITSYACICSDKIITNLVDTFIFSISLDCLFKGGDVDEGIDLPNFPNNSCVVRLNFFSLHKIRIIFHSLFQCLLRLHS